MSRRPLLGWAAAGLLIAGFLAAAGRRPSVPGLWYDEAYDTAPGMELALGLPRMPTDWSVTIAGRSWPLRAAHPYDFSAFGMYWSALAFRVAGASVPVVRWSGLLVAAAGLLCFFGFCREALSEEAAAAATALLAFHPSFFAWSRVAYCANGVFVFCFAAAALWLGAVWTRRRAAWALYAACFTLGLSANASTKALAYIIALPVVFAAWAPREARPPAGKAAAAAGFLLLGAANPLLYTLRGGTVLARLFGSFSGPTLAGVDNWALGSNAALRLSQLGQTLSGRASAWQPAGPLVESTSVVVAAAAAVAVLCWRAARGRPAARRLSGALVSLIALLLLETCFTPMTFDPQHLVVVLPFSLLAVAAALDGLSGRRARAAAAALILALVASEVRVDAAYLSALSRTGGVGLWSDAVEAAAAYLDQAGARAPLCLSWGLARNIYVATGGRLRPVEAHGGRLGAVPEVERLYDEALRDPASRYLLFADGVPNLGQRSGAVLAFKRAAARAGKRLEVERSFSDRAGTPVVLVLRAVS